MVRRSHPNAPRQRMGLDVTRPMPRRGPTPCRLGNCLPTSRLPRSLVLERLVRCSFILRQRWTGISRYSVVRPPGMHITGNRPIWLRHDDGLGARRDRGDPGRSWRVRGGLNRARKAASLSPGSAFANDDEAVALIGLFRFHEAIDAAALAIRLADGKYACMHFHLGSAHFRLGNWQLAEESFEKASGLNPQDDASTYNVALCCQQLGYFADVAHKYQETFRRNPNRTDRQYRLGSPSCSAESLHSKSNATLNPYLTFSSHSGSNVPARFNTLPRSSVVPLWHRARPVGVNSPVPRRNLATARAALEFSMSTRGC